MIRGFAHPGLVVPDLDKAQAFYAEMFGFRVIGQEGWTDAPEVDSAVGLKNSRCKGLMMAGHNCYLELFEFSAPEQHGPEPKTLNANELGIRHLGFYVDDVHAESERIVHLGGSVSGTPVEVAPDCFAIYARDPFGNLIELCQPQSSKEALSALPLIGDS